MSMKVTLVVQGNRMPLPRVVCIEFDSQAGFENWLDELGRDITRPYAQQRYCVTGPPVEMTARV